jgi:3-isopropylmalate/(R)-2-methylmalate dehydratase large subunit
VVQPLTMFEKIWAAHVVEQHADGTALIWIDRHIINEGSSIGAFAELAEREMPVARPGMHLAVADHVVPTVGRELPLAAGRNRSMIEGLERNAARHGIAHIPYRSAAQGICHVIAPELGFVLPGMIVVCGDSHTSTLGGLGAVAFGIGTSEMAHVLATGTLVSAMPRIMEVRIEGTLDCGVSAKDMILAVIGKIGTAGATGCAIEFSGSTVRALEIDARLTLCNMAIEAGARFGAVSPDEVTLSYLKGRRLAPQGADWVAAVTQWRALGSDAGARFDAVVELDAAKLAPQVTWGTSPQDVAGVDERVPDPADITDPARAAAVRRALEYQGLQPGLPMAQVAIDRVFIGSCTNARLSDLHEAARYVRGRKIAPGVSGFVSPGSTGIKQQAEAEGLDRVFIDAGFEWRASACSMCGGAETAPPGTRVATTSNRNFEHRQGRNVRSHLVSPATAAASAVAGHFADPRSAGTRDA